jgi:hypothetical protein
MLSFLLIDALDSKKLCHFDLFIDLLIKGFMMLLL